MSSFDMADMSGRIKDLERLLAEAAEELESAFQRLDEALTNEREADAARERAEARANEAEANIQAEQRAANRIVERAEAERDDFERAFKTEVRVCSARTEMLKRAEAEVAALREACDAKDRLLIMAADALEREGNTHAASSIRNSSALAAGEGT